MLPLSCLLILSNQLIISFMHSTDSDQFFAVAIVPPFRHLTFIELHILWFARARSKPPNRLETNLHNIILQMIGMRLYLRVHVCDFLSCVLFFRCWNCEMRRIFVWPPHNNWSKKCNVSSWEKKCTTHTKKKKQTPQRSNKKKQNHINPTLKGITAATKIGILGYRTEAHRTDRRVAIIIMRLINEPCWEAAFGWGADRGEEHLEG